MLTLSKVEDGLTRRLFGRALMAAGAIAALGGQAFGQASPITTDTEGLVVGNVSIPGRDGGSQPAYAAYPAARGKYPVIIVISEAFGLNEYLRDVCRRLAKAGYFAVAPDLFYRAGDVVKTTDRAQIQRIVATATNEQIMGDVAAILFWAKSQPAADKKYGVTGFSWGGAPVWMVAQRFKEVRAGVAWYGRLRKPSEGNFLSNEVRPWPLDVIPGLQSPVLGLYAGKDVSIPMSDITAMNEGLTLARKKGSQIIVYESAANGFHDDRLSDYNREAATDGWARMLDHFAKNGLKGNVPKPPRR